MIGERQIGEVVEPDRVVQVEGLVALAPGVARALVGVDHQGRDPEPLQARGQGQAVLASADDQAVGLTVMA